LKSPEAAAPAVTEGTDEPNIENVMAVLTTPGLNRVYSLVSERGTSPRRRVAGQVATETHQAGEATGKEASAIELSAEELEERTMPRKAMPRKAMPRKAMPRKAVPRKSF
jgi:hypothetical protein